MLLYHGTSKKSGMKIIETGIIRNDCKRVWNSEDIMITAEGKKLLLETTDGFVYLTDKLSIAARYGNVARIKSDEDSDSYYIFRVEIPDEKLLQDKDELKMNWNMINPGLSAKESLEKCHCVTVDYSINKDEHNMEYIEIPIRKLDYELVRIVRELSSYATIMKEDPIGLVEEIEKCVSWEKVK